MKQARIIRSGTHTYGLVSAVLVLGLLLSGCVKIRLLTYPDSFVWLDQREVQGAMHALYESIQRLDSVLDSGNRNTDTIAQQRHQIDVIAELQRLETIAVSMVTGTSSETGNDIDAPTTNHLLIDEHMNDFVDQIAQARLRAEADPPRYSKAGQLVGECNACHRQR